MRRNAAVPLQHESPLCVTVTDPSLDPLKLLRGTDRVRMSDQPAP